MTSPQLQIPPEGVWLPAEQDFYENEPPGLLPEDQESNWGQVRRTLAAPLNQIDDYLESIWRNMVPQTADIWLDRWEFLVGLPVNPAGKSLTQRRAAVLARFKRGAWSRSKRDALIQSWINADFQGEQAKFTPEGITFENGIPLFNEWVVLDQAFFVYEFIQNFSYTVRIGTTYIQDTEGLRRELERIHPAGFTASVYDDRPIPVEYNNLVIHYDPQAFWVMYEGSGTLAHDLMADRTDGTYVNGPILNDRQMEQSSGNKAPHFDGVNDHVSIAHTTWLDVGDTFTIIALVYRQTDTTMTIFSGSSGDPQLQILNTGVLVGIKQDSTVTRQTATVIPKNQIHLVGYSKDGSGGPGKLWIDGVEDTTGNFFNATMTSSSSSRYIANRAGTSEHFAGNVGQVAIFSHELTADDWGRLNRFRQNIFP